MPFFLAMGCSPKKESVENNLFKEEFSNRLEKLLRNEDSLKIMLYEQIEQKNDVGIVLSYKYLGKHQREDAKFSEAIMSHQSGLDLALKIKDTIEIIQALNDLGTVFRRIGAMSEASNYHYEALRYANMFSDVQNSGRKSRVMALNGIGNISLQLGYYADAEKYFREALKEEIALKSSIGQAINYANLGSVFRHKQEYDSARVYFHRSLEKNIQAKSKLGIGLCRIHLGNLYKIERKFDLAEKEFQEAYTLMENFSDRWHWLNACVALANINLEMNNLKEFSKYIELAKQTANEINSVGHISEIYSLKHDYAIKKHDFEKALEHYKRSIAMKDSVQGIKNTNHYMDLRVNYEREQNSRELKRIEAENKLREEEKRRITNITWMVLISGVVISGVLYYAYYQRTRSNQILKQIERTRTNFFTNLTHEFRTPLTVIQGLNRQLQLRKNLSEKEKSKFRNAIDRQSENVLNLVNQLLDVAKLKSGTDKPQWKKGNIIAYLQMIAEVFQLYAQEKNVQLVFYTDIKAQEMDFIPFYIDKIISNLLSNAVKHTENGDKIDFCITKGKKNSTIIIRVCDNGEGISQNELAHIFELFYQSPNTKDTSGTGIGLAFTKMLVEKMHGNIEVESQLGKGTTFTITLPLRNKNVKNISPIEEYQPKLPINKTSTQEDTQEDYIIKNQLSNYCEQPIILLVEDNKDVSLYIKSLLDGNYKIICAKNGEDGLKLAERYIPDVVITDLMMPIKDGYELCKEMKSNTLLNHIPIIVITAKVSEEDRLQGLKYGIEAYINKPFRSEELLIHIENILESRKILKEKYINTIKVGNGNENRTHNDENLKFLQKVVDIIHSELNNPEFSATFLADKMAISTSQLSRKLNQTTGFSTTSYILQVKLSKAKKMLHDSSVSLSEVADSCGFYDLSYFSRVFKKEFGITPSQYQKNISIHFK